MRVCKSFYKNLTPFMAPSCALPWAAGAGVVDPHLGPHSARPAVIAIPHPQQAGISVSGRPARQGFWHLSAVSADCNRRFGELPPATARRAML